MQKKDLSVSDDLRPLGTQVLHAFKPHERNSRDTSCYSSLIPSPLLAIKGYVTGSGLGMILLLLLLTVFNTLSGGRLQGGQD